jgi:hypothetical protein
MSLVTGGGRGKYPAFSTLANLVMRLLLYWGFIGDKTVVDWSGTRQGESLWWVTVQLAGS